MDHDKATPTAPSLALVPVSAGSLAVRVQGTSISCTSITTSITTSGSPQITTPTEASRELRLRQMKEMEDPTDLHVMPAAPILPSGVVRKDAKAQSYQLTTRAGSHALAASLQQTPDASVNKAAPRRRTVLTEEEYVEALERLVERDYFPDNAIMRRQLELLNSRQYITLRDLRNLNILEERGVHSIHTGDDFDSISTHNAISNKPDVTNCSIDEFFTRFTSEDNESFERIQEKDVKAHRSKFHWVYEPQDAKEAPGYLMLYYMGDKHIKADQRARMDNLLTGPRAVGDDRPSQVETWKFNVRNSFMFPPEPSEDSAAMASQADALNAVRIASGQVPVVSALPASSRLLLQDGSVHGDTSTKANPRVGAVQLEKGINRSSTRLPPASISTSSGLGSWSLASPLEYPHTPTTITSSEDDAMRNESSRSGFDPRMRYLPVAMTPSPLPSADAILAERLITWGTLFAPPVRLDKPSETSASVPGRSNDNQSALHKRHSAESVQSLMQLIKSEDEAASRFQIAGPSRREVVAREMDAAARRRVREKEAAEQARRSASGISIGLLSSSSSRSSSISSIKRPGSTSSRRASVPMSPAAEALARRIATPSPFDIGLRSSYGSASSSSSSSSSSARTPTSTSKQAYSITPMLRPGTASTSMSVNSSSSSSAGPQALLTPRSIKMEQQGAKHSTTSATTNANLTDGLLKL